MKLLVTGGAGFIGANLVRHLIHHTDHAVVNLDKLTYAGNMASILDVADDPRYRFEHVDLCDADAVTGVFRQHKPDAVMHLAAESHVDRSIDSPGDFIQTNVVGTYNLLQASLNHYSQLDASKKDAFRFLHVSTDEVYGSLGMTDPGFNESTAYSPHSPYSASKASSDHLARAWNDTFKLPVLVTNCSNNYGPYQFPEKLIPVVILKCLHGEPIPVYGKGENVRDWLYVDDHCRALTRVIEAGTPGQTYNIGGNNERSNLDLVKMLCELLDEFRPATNGKPHADNITFVSDRPGHDLRYAIDATKISQQLGWQPKENFVSGFRKTVAWYLENETWWQDILSGDYRLTRQGTRD